MPPLDWSIIQSKTLELILPAFGISAVIMFVATKLIKTEQGRNAGASLAIVAGFACGNVINKLIVGFDTGWRGLFWATVIAGVSELVMTRIFPKSSRSWLSVLASVMIAGGLAFWLVEWSAKESRIGLWLLFVSAILLNWNALNVTSRRRFGYWVPLFAAIIWGGSATALIILSHSGRFADLSMLLSCCLSGVGVISLWKRQTLADSFAEASVFIPGLIVATALNTYSDIPQVSFVLVAIQPAILTILNFKQVADWFDRHPMTLVLLASLPGLISVGLAARAEL